MLYDTNMKFTASDYNILSYLLKKNIYSFDQITTWAFGQYTDEGVDEFIEKISLSYDSSEIIELISQKY